ncbi:MAG: hypothetical protein ABL883_13675 [Terricaulis sp.]
MLIAVAAVSAAGACGRAPDTGARQVTGHPSEFFPRNVGSSWTYRVTLDDPDLVVRSEEVAWPRLSGAELIVAVRGVLPYSGNPLEGPLYLTLQLGEAADQQGPHEYPEGYKLRVTRDDLGLYEGATGLYWAIPGSGRYEVHQILTYDAESALSSWKPPSGYDLEAQGYNERITYFVDNLGTRLQFQGSLESMALDDIVHDIEGQAGKDCLQFSRAVEGTNLSDTGAMQDVRGRLTMSLLEKTWFCRGVGLVRLEQYVGGDRSMTWTLTDYDPASD